MTDMVEVWRPNRDLTKVEGGRRKVLMRDQYLTVARIQYQPGEDNEFHFHEGTSQALYVIEGEFEIAVDGKAPQRLKAGDSFFNPAGVPHEGKNVGATKVRIVGTYFVEKVKPLTTPVK